MSAVNIIVGVAGGELFPRTIHFTRDKPDYGTLCGGCVGQGTLDNTNSLCLNLPACGYVVFREVKI